MKPSRALSRHDAVARQSERGVHVASPHDPLAASDTKRSHHSVRTLRRRERRAPLASHNGPVLMVVPQTASFGTGGARSQVGVVRPASLISTPLQRGVGGVTDGQTVSTVRPGRGKPLKRLPDLAHPITRRKRGANERRCATAGNFLKFRQSQLPTKVTPA
jgi:hypothetical protein